MELSALNHKKIEAWMDLDEEVSVKVRYLTREEIMALAKAAREVFFDRKSHKKTEKLDPLDSEVAVAQAAVVDWRGLTMGGTPYPCTPENVAFLARKWTIFGQFVSGAAGDLRRFAEEEQAEDAKNS